MRHFVHIIMHPERVFICKGIGPFYLFIFILACTEVVPVKVAVITCYAVYNDFENVTVEFCDQLAFGRIKRTKGIQVLVILWIFSKCFGGKEISAFIISCWLSLLGIFVRIAFFTAKN